MATCVILYLEMTLMQAEQEPEEFRTRLNENGRLVIPAPMRRVLNLKPNEELILRVESDELRLTTAKKRAERARQMFQKYVGKDVRLSEELIADRRKEAAGE